MSHKVRLKLAFFVIASALVAWYVIVKVNASNQLQFSHSQICQAAVASELHVAFANQIKQTGAQQFSAQQQRLHCQIKENALLLSWQQNQQLYRFEPIKQQLSMIRVNSDRPNRVREFTLEQYQNPKQLDLAQALRQLFGESNIDEQAIEQSIILQKANYICGYTQIERANVKTLYRNPEDFEAQQQSSAFLEAAQLFMPYIDSQLSASEFEPPELALYQERLHQLPDLFAQKMPEQMQWLEQSETKELAWLQTQLLSYHLKDLAKQNPRLHIPLNCTEQEQLNRELFVLLDPIPG